MNLPPRSIDDIEADLQATEIAYQAKEAQEGRLREQINEMQAELECRIKQTFAVEYAAIAEVERALATEQLRNAPIRRRLDALYAERKQAKLSPGMVVYWARSDGWNGKRDTRVKVVQVRADRVQIDTGEFPRPLKWVQLKNLSIGRGL